MQRAWLREFNSLGLQLRPQAAKLVTSYLQDCEEPQATVEKLVENVKLYFKSKQGMPMAVITAEVIENVISFMKQAKAMAAANPSEVMMEDVHDHARQELRAHELGDGIQVYDALKDVKPFHYIAARKEWVPSQERMELFPSVQGKAQLFVERYHLLWQRLLLEGQLVSEAQASTNGLLPGQRVITPVESLVGNPGPKLTFGLLSRDQSANELDGVRRWVIEDLHKVYPLELNVPELDRLVTDGSFVLAEGEVVSGGRFVVHTLTVPTAVSHEVSMEKDHVPVQIFGGNLSQEQLDYLRLTEVEHAGESHVVLSEVHLDNSQVVERLSDLLQGHEDADPPKVYVFMGSFCSQPFMPTAEGIKAYKEGFERLKLMLRRLPKHEAKKTRFIFIPGPCDPGGLRLPRAPLPNYLTSDIAKEIPNVIMASNPCRIRHCSREVVYFRHDVLRLLRQHAVAPLRHADASRTLTTSEVQQQVVTLLLDQAHLAPLPLEESNILWAFDHTLRLYPLPAAIFVGGATTLFNCSYQGCQFAGVGPFRHGGNFYTYYPIEDNLLACEVPEPAN